MQRLAYLAYSVVQFPLCTLKREDGWRVHLPTRSTAWYPSSCHGTWLARSFGFLRLSGHPFRVGSLYANEHVIWLYDHVVSQVNPREWGGRWQCWIWSDHFPVQPSLCCPLDEMHRVGSGDLGHPSEDAASPFSTCRSFREVPTALDIARTHPRARGTGTRCQSQRMHEWGGVWSKKLTLKYQNAPKSNPKLNLDSLEICVVLCSFV